MSGASLLRRRDAISLARPDNHMMDVQNCLSAPSPAAAVAVEMAVTAVEMVAVEMAVVEEKAMEMAVVEEKAVAKQFVPCSRVKNYGGGQPSVKCEGKRASEWVNGKESSMNSIYDLEIIAVATALSNKRSYNYTKRNWSGVVEEISVTQLTVKETNFSEVDMMR